MKKMFFLLLALMSVVPDLSAQALITYNDKFGVAGCPVAEKRKKPAAIYVKTAGDLQDSTIFTLSTTESVALKFGSSYVSSADKDVRIAQGDSVVIDSIMIVIGKTSIDSADYDYASLLFNIITDNSSHLNSLILYHPNGTDYSIPFNKASAYNLEMWEESSGYLYVGWLVATFNSAADANAANAISGQIEQNLVVKVTLDDVNLAD